jgi:arylsulfate sulfotransferase
VKETPQRRSYAPRATAFAATLCLPLTVLFAGCNARFDTPAPQSKQPTPPPSPPSGPPPASGQGGTVSISPQYVVLSPGQSFQFTATVTGGAQTEWSVNGVQGGSAAMGTVTATGDYMAPASIAQSEDVIVTVALSGSAQQNYATAVVSIILPGQVSCPSDLGNPLVAQYSLYLPAPGKMDVQFGTTTSYGLVTWQVPTPSPNGGGIQIWVAGMKGSTLYHMRAQVTLNNGATWNDVDHTCMTGTPPVTSPVNATTSNGATPQPGIELWNTLLPASDTQVFASDLSGNVIWTYAFPHSSSDYLQGLQLLPNGNFLTLVSYLSSVTTPQSSSVINEIREIDLDGNTVESLNMTTLNQKLAAGNFQDAEGNVYQLGSFHHAVLALPNGHFVLLATYFRTFNNLSGETTPSTTVIGDALVDVDQNFNPDWVWNTFDHLDINRRPMNFPDWTHSNGMLYSTDDHNLLLSMRHQNWIIKINFLDGTGSGDVMWHLGEGGDFKLVGATDPTDWFYAQHGMNYFTPNTTGVFRIGLMDNGNDRIFPSGQVKCLPGSSNPQCYSTMPVLELNESQMTATMVTHYVPPPSYFSFFGGNAELLDNNDIEVDFCGAAQGAIVQELDPTGTQVVWQGTTAHADQFHVYRLPSLYPGVQW